MYGIEEAILIENIYFWIRKNAANEQHQHNERYWTYNSISAYAKLFPYMSEDKLRRHIDKLCVGNEEKSIKPFLLKDNFNDSVYLRTSWYTFTDEGLKVLNDLGYDIKCILPNAFGKNAKGFGENAKHTYNKQDNKHKEEEDKSSSKKNGIDYDRIVVEWNNVAEKCGLSTINGMRGKRRDKLNALFNVCDTTQDELIALIQSLPYADDWVLGNNKSSKWKISFDWLIANKSNWYVRGLEGEMHKSNKKAYEDAFLKDDGTYRPQVDGISLIWNEYYQTYITFVFDIQSLTDGYTRDNRPSSAKVLKNGIHYVWDVESKMWIDEKDKKR